MIVIPENTERDLEKRTGRKDTKRSNGVGKEEREKGRGSERQRKTRSIFIHPVSTN